MRGEIRREVALAHQRNRLHGHRPATWEAAYAQVLLTRKTQSSVSLLFWSSRQLSAVFDSHTTAAGQPVRSLRGPVSLSAYAFRGSWH